MRVPARAGTRLGAPTLVAALAWQPANALAQTRPLTGYYQNVLIAVERRAPFSGGATDAQRGRVMFDWKRGPLGASTAYEQRFVWQGNREGLAAGLFPGLSDATSWHDGDWLRLDGTLHDGAQVSWRHRVDRAALTYASGPVTATVGRQAISWATTLFLTPADPFRPFDPADPFREYRTGVDAMRLQWFPGPFSVVDVVVRGASYGSEHTLTALARGKTSVRGWELSAWGGAVHDQAAGAIGVTRTIAGSALRMEAAVRQDTLHNAVLRAAIGMDRRVTLWGRDLYGVIEYQHDSFGAGSVSQLPGIALSAAAVHQELQVYGRDEAATQLSYQVHPLVSAELLSLVNLRDGSTLLSPAIAASLSANVALRVGAFLGVGRSSRVVIAPRSEYGGLPATGYAALSMFF
jgi:hypothetical protein